MPLDSEENPLWDGLEPLSSEKSGFAPDQMVRCENCLRVNPPTRTTCLYCAAQLTATEASAAVQIPTLRRLEQWEQGFNTILVPQTVPLDENVLTEASRLLRLQPEDFRRIAETGVPAPLTRAATREEAALIERKLGELNVKVLVAADSELGLAESALKRVHALELTDSALLAHAHGGGKPQRAAWDEVELIVTGRLFVRQIEVEERKGRKAENEIMEAREVNADEAVLDLYTAQSREGWRVSSSSFNFSCLGARKSLVTGQNFSTLVEVLRERALGALYDDSYNRVRRALNVVWPFEQRTESRGWRRGGPGKINTEAVTRSDNELQFTRYSRLRNYLRLNHPEL